MPSNVKYNYVWSAAPGIDLRSAAAAVARAFTESMRITLQGDLNAGYPGYDRAIARLANMHFSPADLPVLQVDGTYYMHLLRLELSADGVRHAVICSWRNGLGYTEGNTYSSSSALPGLWVEASTIDMRPKSADSTIDSAPLIGPARAPVTDIFAGWTFPSADLVSASDEQACQALTDTTIPPEYRATTTRKLDHPMPTLPPTPGWPASS
ncbi:hypothetical protein [Antrihabitans cavernicola]|uniref:Uncharacterized protein n=1 Tax=Antrihabitans cavernicola TaxID=2495913 RepID=A0A5A7SKJ0_9NOCA|nr:hypothetical protein [Spelaeibacter cavernicola]KAA0024985.1 hypothetical protein FOY51_03475 [Spelaeibacter cavernicola]